MVSALTVHWSRVLTRCDLLFVLPRCGESISPERASWDGSGAPCPTGGDIPHSGGESAVKAERPPAGSPCPVDGRSGGEGGTVRRESGNGDGPCHLPSCAGRNRNDHGNRDPPAGHDFRHTVSAAGTSLDTTGRRDQCRFPAVFSSFDADHPGVSHFTADRTSCRTCESTFPASPCRGGRYGPPYRPQ